MDPAPGLPLKLSFLPHICPFPSLKLVHPGWILDAWVQKCGSGFQITTCHIPDSATCRLKSETPIASSCPKAPVCGTGGFPHLIPPNLPPQHLLHPVCFGLPNPCACRGTTLHFIIPHDCPVLPWTPTHPNPVHPSGSRQTPQAEHGQCLGPSRNDTLPGGRD